MKDTHDLVIIGVTHEGIYAAKKAIDLKKRVALVQQPLTSHLGASKDIFVTAYSQITHLYQRLHQWQDTPLYPRWDRLRSWGKTVDATVKARDSLAILAARGVDVIATGGEFVRLPRLAFVAGDRKLTARSYLIATGCRPRVDDILGLGEIRYLTPHDLWKIEDLESIPQNLGIIGEHPLALQIAQLLRRFGKTITLIVPSERLLAREDPQIAHLVRVVLEAEGIEVLTGQSVSQVKAIEGKKLLQLGNRVIEVDEILIAGNEASNGEGLNLAGVGVKVASGTIVTNARLQTTHPQIYACSLPENGYADADLDRGRAAMAVHNALSRNPLSFDPLLIPRIIPLDPPIARIGLSEQQARELYPDRVHSLQSPLKTSIAATLWGETTGFGKIVFRNDGKLLGAHLIGAGIEESIPFLALVLQKNLSLSSLDRSLYPFATFSEMIGEILDRVPPQRGFFHWLQRLYRG